MSLGSFVEGLPVIPAVFRERMDSKRIERVRCIGVWLQDMEAEMYVMRWKQKDYSELVAGNFIAAK